MKGFLTTKNTRKADFVGDELEHVSYANTKKIENAKKFGYIFDKENDIFVLPGYGAFDTNINAAIKSIKGIQKYYDKILKCNPYERILKNINEGYVYKIGPAFPTDNGIIVEGCKGLYCVNYLEMAKKLQKEDNVNQVL